MAEFRFRDTVRLGTRGRHFAIPVTGGLGGLVVDLRDVPLRLPDRADPILLLAWTIGRGPAPDLVFLDVQMPELDGFGVVAAMHPAHKPEIIFVTANDSEHTRRRVARIVEYPR